MITEKPNTINLAIAFDQNYITPFYVLLTSIFYNNKESNVIIHTIATGVDEQEKNKICEYVHQNNGSIFFYEIDKNSVSGFGVPENSWLTAAAYYRLFFPSLIPKEVEKLIYIDTDTIIIGNLSDLYNLNIGSIPVAAVQETLRKPRPELGIYDRQNYFNSGVMLINIPEWKKQEISEKAIRYVRDFPGKLKCVDQDALNVVLVNNWYQLDRNYNVMFQDIPIDLPVKKYESFLKEKVIIHFSLGDHKPWRALCQNKFRYLYHYYLKKSPRSFEKKYTDFEFTPYKVYKFYKIKIREMLLGHPRTFHALKKTIRSIFFFLD